MNATDYFLSANPAEPWSFYPIGLPAFFVVALALVLLTVWTYFSHPQATARRMAIAVTLRLLALLVVLLTAIRPTVGIQEDPKLPSTLLIGIDMSQSMTVPDEVNNQPRITAVRRVLDKVQPTLDTLQNEQNVNVVLYGFGKPDFTDGDGRYNPDLPADLSRSDYGTYLNRTFERWQAERFIHGHILIGDGADNGVAFSAETEAIRWRRAGRPLNTFAVGRTDTASDSRDVALASAGVISGNPDGSVFIKTEFTLKVVINAFGFVGARVPLKVYYDEGKGYREILTEMVTLSKERGNEVDLRLKAPDLPGEVKLKVEVPIESVPGDVAPTNNVIETYLTVTKEGMRVLLVGRASYEHAAIRRALLMDRRIDLYEVYLQPGASPGPGVREDFDFARQGYDVIILGNVSARQLLSVDVSLPQQIAEQVLQRGTGLLFTGGHATFLGTPDQPEAGGWSGVSVIESILPVDLSIPAPVPARFFTAEDTRYQYLPTAPQQGHYLNRLADTVGESNALWAKLNARDNRVRFTGLSPMGLAKPTATIFAVASDAREDQPIPYAANPRQAVPLLVGHQIGAGDRGRVLAFAAMDTNLWKALGKGKEGPPLHARFWRQLVRWLAHQEEDEGAAFARPEWRRGPVGGKQTVRVGLRAPGGALLPDAKLEVKIMAPGEDPANALPRTVIPDPDTGGFKVLYDPLAAGEYNVTVRGTGTDSTGKEVKGEATARFLAYPETTDEMLRKAADHDYLKRLANAGGGRFYRLEDLPSFLNELASQPLETAKPKPRYLPDWRRDHSKGFLPAWLVIFVTLLGTEWALRRYWGMV